VEDLIMFIRYVDRFALADGQWRFGERRVEVLFTGHRRAAGHT
jgi:hypothetical protein